MHVGYFFLEKDLKTEFETYSGPNIRMVIIIWYNDIQVLSLNI